MFQFSQLHTPREHGMKFFTPPVLRPGSSKMENRLKIPSLLSANASLQANTQNYAFR